MAIDLKKYNLSRQTLSLEPKLSLPKSNLLSFFNRDFKILGNSFSDKKKERFYSELNILFTAGIDIKTALELIEEEQSNVADKQILKNITEAVIAGGSLSQAIHETGFFSDYEYFSIQIGEESGSLPEVLKELSVFYSKKIKQKRQIVNALSYPSIVLVTALGAVYFMLSFVVPMFSDVFKRFKGELPYLTKLIIHISGMFSKYALYFFVFLILSISLIYVQRKKEWFRKLTSSIVLKLPVIGPIVTKIYLARFCHSMNLLISAKTPLINALDLVKKMVGFYPLEYSINVIREEILKGESLFNSLSKFKIYNRRMISLIKVGEEVNQLDVIFAKLAKQYTDDVEHQTSTLGSLIEPIMIIFLGVLVAVILLAMYLPLFQLSTAVGI